MIRIFKNILGIDQMERSIKSNKDAISALDGLVKYIDTVGMGNSCRKNNAFLVQKRVEEVEKRLSNAENSILYYDDKISKTKKRVEEINFGTLESISIHGDSMLDMTKEFTASIKEIKDNLKTVKMALDQANRQTEDLTESKQLLSMCKCVKDTKSALVFIDGEYKIVEFNKVRKVDIAPIKMFLAHK